MPRVKPRIRADLLVEELDGEAVVFDETNGAFHHLNSTATVVFGLCDGTATMPQLAADVAHAFDLPVEEVELQIRTLVGQFRRAKLLSVSGPQSRSESL